MPKNLDLWTPTHQPTNEALMANLERLAYYSSDWVAGTYTEAEIVKHRGCLWYCKAAAGGTVLEPSFSSADWELLAPDPGTGAMSLSAPIAGPNITATYQTITQFDQQDQIVRGLTYDLVAGTIQINYPGTWAHTIFLSIEHDEQNFGRSFFLRIFNQTQGIPSPGSILRVGVGRNQNVTATTIPISKHYIDDANLGDVFRLEIGGGDTFASVIWGASRRSPPRPRAATDGLSRLFGGSGRGGSRGNRICPPGRREPGSSSGLRTNCPPYFCGCFRSRDLKNGENLAV